MSDDLFPGAPAPDLKIAQQNAVAMLTATLDDPNLGAFNELLRQVIAERGLVGIYELLPAVVLAAANALTLLGEDAGLDPREVLQRVARFYADDSRHGR